MPFPALLGLMAAAYFVAGKLGLSLALVNSSASAVWPPTGIALAATLTLGYRVWPSILVGAFLVNFTTAGTVATSLGIATGNTLEALIGAWLVNRYAGGRRPFDRSRDTFRFTVLAGIVSTAVSATIGVTSLSWGGFARWPDYEPIWLTWWLGDLGGALVVAPFLLLWIGNPRVRWGRSRAVEALLLLVAVLAVGQVGFGWLSPEGELGASSRFLCMPVLIWAAYRFDRRVAASAIVVLSAVAVWGTFRDTGSIEAWRTNESLVWLQVFMGVTAMTTLSLAAAVAERRRAAEEARVASAELQDAMSELESFSSSISHDLRSPVGAILNTLAIMESDFQARLGAEGHHLVGRIRLAAESAERLLDQLAHFTWVGEEARGEALVDMGALAREAHAEVIVGAEGNGAVHVEIRALPPARGNRTLLLRVFRNLFSNAMKYHRSLDGRRVEVGGFAGAQENVYYVADNGIGFDPEFGKAVFQPFRRLGSGQAIAGSGLGLAIVARIVRKHGGRVWAESDGATGARFCFSLPNGRNGAVARAPAADDSQDGGGPGEETPRRPRGQGASPRAAVPVGVNGGYGEE